MNFSVILNRLGEVRILVSGDVILDRYWFGEVNRISPEAPVPIVKIEKSEERLGGAANVARNAAALGASTALLGVVGADEAAGKIERLLRSSKITSHLKHDDSTSTIIKLRVIGRQQQLLRLDFEQPPSTLALQDTLSRFNTFFDTHDVVVLSDYAKGSLANISAMIASARNANIPVLVDPKGDDFSCYRNASVLTPNRSELRAVVGAWRSESELNEKAQNLRASLAIDALLVTRSEEGMSLFTKNEVMHVPTVAREVFDVSGAGDTVIATLAVMLAAGENIEDAVLLANHAAGIVVGKLGTATVTRGELFGSQ